MGKLAFVFPGQGAQKPGMGQALYQWHPLIRQQLDHAEALRPGSLQQCFEGPEALLKDTLNAQPCLYALGLATARALHQDGVQADMAAGFSLGEISALAYGGLFKEDEGFRFVNQRAAIMAGLARGRPGAMAAVLKLEDDKVEAFCRQIGELWPVNYNSPGQLVVAGNPQRLEQLAQAVQAAGGRVMPLAVSGAFHSPYMDEAEAALRQALAGYRLTAPRIPVYANLSAQPYGPALVDTLSRQVNHPVRWQQSVRAMVADGANRFIELGPGSTLAGLIRRIDPSVKVLSITDQASYEMALQLGAREASHA